MQLLTHHLAVDYDWDSYSEESETGQALSQELRPLIEQRYLAGSIDYDELKEYVEEWAAEQLNEDDD